MTRPRLSVAMIVKNEEAHIMKTLASVGQIADEIVVVDTGSTDRTKEILGRFERVKLYDLKLEPFHFGDARNFSFSKCTGEWILWLDADDLLKNAEGVLEEIKNAAETTDAFFAVYNYAFNKSGMCVARHWKERLIRNNGSMKWAGVLHESVIPNRELKVFKTDKFEINHDKDDESFARSSQRNYDIIRKWIADEGLEKTDPRNVLSLANACLGLNRWSEAIPYYDEFTRRSGWDQEVYVAFHRMAGCYRALALWQEAIECELKAIAVQPDVKDAYIGLGQTYVELKDWNKAEYWLTFSLSKKTREAVVFNPAEYSFNPWYFLGTVYANKASAGEGAENVDKALECFEKCLIQMPDDEDLKKRVKFLSEMVRQKRLAEMATEVGSYIKAEEDEEKLRAYVKSLPKLIQDFPSICKMRSSVLGRKVSSGKDVSIFCGDCFEVWTPDSMKTSGVGGSEEAVIHMAKRLAALGWNVEVFNSIPEEKVFDGVSYKPWWMFSTETPTDMLVIWRMPQFFDASRGTCKKTYLWMHDVTQPGEFTEKRLSRIDKVMFLSKAHRSLFPNVPEEKVMYTGNGIDTDMLIADAGVAERHPWKMINTSAPDRGLDTILKMWPKIRAKYPEAEFHWFYGWQTYDSYNAGNLERMAFKEEILKLMKQPGVFERGRVSHDVIARETASADIWLYPTEFFETSCITAMKCQALGAVPATTDVGALKETVFSGQKLDLPRIYSDAGQQDVFIDALQLAHDAPRDGMMDEARRRFSWDAVAKQWDEEFKA